MSGALGSSVHLRQKVIPQLILGVRSFRKALPLCSRNRLSNHHPGRSTDLQGKRLPLPLIRPDRDPHRVIGAELKVLTVTSCPEGQAGQFDFKGEIGGAEGDRTPDLMNAIHARSQLRHSPTGNF